MIGKNLGIFLLAGVLASSAGPSAAGSYGTELPFVAGTGGRASGLGLAATGILGEPSLQHFNPAGLVGIDRKTVEFYRTTFFDSKSMYHTASYAHPMMDYGTLGISVLRLDVAGIEERDVFNILLDDNLKNSQTRVLLGYAFPLQSFLSAGLNLKVDNQTFAGHSGSGIGLDIGFLASKSFADPWIFETLRGGLAIQNLIEPSVKLDQDDVADPMNIAFGLSASASTGNLRFLTSLDLVSPRYSPFRARLGQEFSYLETFNFRAGLDGSTPTFGVGAGYKNVTLNYAYRDEDLGSNHRISVSVGFGKSLEEKHAQARTRLETELNRQITSKMSELESSQVANTLQTADSLFELGSYADAQNQYEFVLLWDSDNQPALSQIEKCLYHEDVRRGREAIVSGDYLQALFYLRQALKRSPGDATANALLDECNQRIRADQDRSDMLERMLKSAIDLYASRRFVEALSSFREILKLDGDNALAAEYEKKTYINIENLKAALIVESNHLAGRGDLGAAVSALEQARVYAPDDTWISRRIETLKREISEAARTRTSQPKPPGASVPAARPVSRPSVDASLLEPKYKTGLQHFEKGDFDAAVRYFMDVWSVAPEFHNVAELLTKAHLFTGMKLYSEGRYEEAIRTWELALTVDPGNMKAKRYLRKAREESNRLGRVNDE